MNKPTFFNLKNMAFLGIIFLLSLVPFTLYFMKFGKQIFIEVDASKADWGTFGDFIGGTLNTILTFILIVYTTWSFYQSQKLNQELSEQANQISKYANELTNRVHEESKIIQQQQVRPYAVFLNDYEKDSYSLSIYNGGLGPLIVKSLKYKKSGVIKDYINEFIASAILKYPPTKVITPRFLELVVAPNSKQVLFTVIKGSSMNVPFLLTEIYQELNNTKILLEFTDIFGNEFSIEEVDLKFEMISG